MNNQKWNWVIGVSLILAGLGSLSGSTLVGLFLILVGIILLPPIARKIKEKYGYSLFINFTSRLNTKDSLVKNSVCPHCKEEVNPKAVRCPHCQGKIYRWTLGRKILLGFFAFGIIYIIVTINSDTKPNSGSGANNNISTPKEKYSDVTVCVEARHVLESYLKSPSTAKYPTCNSTYIKRLDSDGFVVSSYVDSQNGFGAVLRSNWEVKFYYNNNGQTIQIDYVIINGETMFSKNS